ncbi:MAG: hypothetical protein L0Y54_18220, partial [Sporichthyaceae bacterium]|nr:hypothetical protein [Sporichthyaceae bacterium]
QGSGRVVGINVPSDTVTVRLNETGRRCVCSRASVCGSRQAYDAAYPEPGATGATGAVTEPAG